MSKHSDTQLMTAIVAGGIGAVAGAMFMIAKAKAATLQGLGYATRYQPGANRQINLGAVIGWQPQRTLRGWGTPGFTGAGRGTGAAIYWRRVS